MVVERVKNKLEQITDKNLIMNLFEFICVENIPFRIVDDGFDILLYNMNDNSLSKFLNKIISLEYKTVNDVNGYDKITFSFDLNDDN
jgi:hypothetical protein